MTKTRFPRLFLAMFAALVCCALVPAAAFAADKDPSYHPCGDNVSFLQHWNQAISSTTHNSILKLDQDIVLSGRLELGSSDAAGVQVTIDLNGHKLIGDEATEDEFIYAHDNVVLTIKDSSAEQTGEITLRVDEDGDAKGYEEIIRATDGAELRLESGTIRGNEDNTCLTVSIEDDALFKMSGGAIVDNWHGDPGFTFTPSFYDHGSAVEVDDARFEMSGGLISNNLQTADGGTVYIDCDNSNSKENDFGFVMTGGEISGNTVNGKGGGGVYVDDGRAKFVGGIIQKNAAGALSSRTDENADGAFKDESACAVTLATGAESSYFGGDFKAPFNGSGVAIHGINVWTIDAPVIGGRAQLEAVYIDDSWYRFGSPGVAVDMNTIDTSIENHAWVGLCEVSDSVKLYTDRAEKNLAKDPKLTRCFYTCEKAGADSWTSLAYETPQTMCAIYKNGSITHIGIVDEDNHSEAPICITEIDKITDFEGKVVQNAAYASSWDARTRTHSITLTEKYNMWDIPKWFKQKYAGNGSKKSIGECVLLESDEESGIYKYVFPVTNSVKDGSKEYVREAYNYVVVNTKWYGIEYTATGKPQDKVRELRASGYSVSLDAKYDVNSDSFNCWSLDVENDSDRESFERWFAENDMAAKLGSTHLEFRMPPVKRLLVTALYHDTYSISGEGFTAYRLDPQTEGEAGAEAGEGVEAGFSEVKVTAPQMAGRKIKLQADNAGDAFSWHLFKVEKGANGKTVRTDVSDELLDEGEALTAEPDFVMPSYKLYVTCVTASFYVNSPHASVSINGGEASAPGKTVVAKDPEITLTFNLDSAKVPVGKRKIAWKLNVLFNNGDVLETGDLFLPGNDWRATLSFSQLTSNFFDLNQIRGFELSVLFGKVVAFDANGGTGAMDTVYRSATARSAYSLPECEFTAPEGKRFAGWSISKTGDPVAPDESINLKEDITLYAIWEDVPFFTVTLHANNSDSDVTESREEKSGTYPLPACPFVPSSDGLPMMFLGWAEEPDGNPIAAKTIQLTGPKDLYAVWQIEHVGPSYPIPAPIKTLCGTKLSDIQLDGGFAWDVVDSGSEIVTVSNCKYAVAFGDIHNIPTDITVSHDYADVTREPTCTAQGYDLLTCKGCGEQKIVGFRSEKGHTMGKWTVVAPEGCGNAGFKTRSCIVCGFTESEEVESVDHKFAAKYAIDQRATLKTDGSMSRHCQNHGCPAVIDSKAIPAMGAMALSKTTFTYNGKSQKPSVKVTDREGKTLTLGVDYIISFANTVKAGKATVVVEGIGKYDGNVISSYTISKAAQKIKIVSKSSTLKAKKLKKKARNLKALKTSGTKGKKSFKKVGGSKKLTISSSGKIKVKKGTKKGTYKIKVKLTSAATDNYKAASVTKTIKVKVK